MFRGVCRLIGLALALGAAARTSSLAAPADTRPPNILLIVSDDQRADAIGAYDNPHIETPHLDRLVREGVSFRNAYCMGSMHGAVCQPSRAMLNSGRTLYRAPLDLQSVPILPEVLRKAGYTTFGTGKWHNGRASFARGFSKGRAIFFGGMSNHLKVPIVDLITDGQSKRFGPVRTGDRFSSELFADAAVDFLEHHPPDKPFYCYVAFTAPHDPRMPPAAYHARYQQSPPPLPANFMPQHPFNNGWLTGRDESLAPWPRTPEIIRQQLGEYYGMISHMDAQVGRILRALEAAGHRRRTIIIFTSDHGLALGSHGLLGKQNLYEHSMKSPLIVVGPGIPSQRSIDALVYLFDLFPTICHLAHATIPQGVEGRDLVPLWRGDATAVHNSLFTAYENSQRAVRDTRWKLIRYPRINKTQLFDLQNDPNELTDLAGDPQHQPTVDRLMQSLRAWRQRVGDYHPLRVEHPEPQVIDLTGRPRKPDRHQPPEIVRKYFSTP